MAIYWLIIAVVMGVVEASTAQLVSIWFALGAVGGCITSLITDNLWIQIGVAVLVCTITLIATRPLAKRVMSTPKTHTNADKNIGKIAVVLSDIDNLKSVGEVKVGSVIWSAKSANSEIIKKDSKVKVIKIEGVKLVVELCE